MQFHNLTKELGNSFPPVVHQVSTALKACNVKNDIKAYVQAVVNEIGKSPPIPYIRMGLPCSHKVG